MHQPELISNNNLVQTFLLMKYLEPLRYLHSNFCLILKADFTIQAFKKHQEWKKADAPLTEAEIIKKNEVYSISLFLFLRSWKAVQFIVAERALTFMESLSQSITRPMMLYNNL